MLQVLNICLICILSEKKNLKVDWLRASDIVFRMSREMEMNIGGTNVTPGSVVLCAAQLLAERLE